MGEIVVSCKWSVVSTQLPNVVETRDNFEFRFSNFEFRPLPALATDKGQGTKDSSSQLAWRKCTISPSCTMYSLPSRRNWARTRASAKLPADIKSSYLVTSARINPR